MKPWIQVLIAEDTTGAHCRVNGREVVNFAAYNFLGIASEPEIKVFMQFDIIRLFIAHVTYFMHCHCIPVRRPAKQLFENTASAHAVRVAFTEPLVFMWFEHDPCSSTIFSHIFVLWIAVLWICIIYFITIFNAQMCILNSKKRWQLFLAPRRQFCTPTLSPVFRVLFQHLQRQVTWLYGMLFWMCYLIYIFNAMHRLSFADTVTIR